MIPPFVSACIVAALFGLLTMATCLSNRPPSTFADWVRIASWSGAAAIMGFLLTIVVGGAPR